MKLKDAYLCVDCNEVFEKNKSARCQGPECPSCASCSVLGMAVILDRKEDENG